MRVQSLSVSVPGTGCINKCKFCVSRMRPKDEYQERNFDSDEVKKEYLDRLVFAKEVGCNTMMITGTLEPQQNKKFLDFLGDLNRELDHPFRNIEIQTTGIGMSSENFFWLKDQIGVKTVSVSVSCLDSDKVWKEILGTTKDINLENTCESIRYYGLNLRLSLNLTDYLLDSMKIPTNTQMVSEIEEYTKKIFERCKKLGASQVTLRKMYLGPQSPQTEWLMQHRISDDTIGWIQYYIKHHGRYLDTLEYGQSRYSVNGMSVVLDNDCMAKEQKEPGVLKYLILRENGKLYTSWDDPGSLIF